MLRLIYQATIVCEHKANGRGCTATEKYTADPESLTVEQFGDEAAAKFRRSGWQVASPLAPSNLCPDHATR